MDAVAAVRNLMWLCCKMLFEGILTCWWFLIVVGILGRGRDTVCFALLCFPIINSCISYMEISSWRGLGVF